MAEPTRELTGARVVLEPLAQQHAAALTEIHRKPDVTAFWSEPEASFPFDEPTSARWAITAGGEVAGMIQYYEETEPEARHAGIDIFVDPDRHNQGIATDAITTLVDHLTADLGHHRIVIDPETRNTAAIRCYEKAGFEPVGVMKRSFLIDGEWRDCLLMELIRMPAA